MGLFYFEPYIPSTLDPTEVAKTLAIAGHAIVRFNYNIVCNGSNSHQFSLSLDLDKEQLGIDLLNLEPVEEREGGVCESPVHHLPQLREEGNYSVGQKRQPWEICTHALTQC